MAKDKPAKRISMKEVIAEKAGKDAPKSAIKEEQIGNEVLFSTEQNEKLKKYNETITDFNEKYTSLVPRFNVLVRAFVKPMEVSESGVLKPNTVAVKAPTKSGVGTIGYMNNPFPLLAKAVVVSVPEEIKDLQRGDIVALSKNQVIGQAIGQGDNARVVIPNAFVHPDEVTKYPADEPIPHDPSDYNYGYLEIKPYDIPFIIKKVTD